MFADVEILSNYTYKFSKFTYSIPTRLTQKIKIGSMVRQAEALKDPIDKEYLPFQIFYLGYFHAMDLKQ